MPASLKAQDLVVRGETTLVLHDLLVGEVWFCSGQSNMEWQLSRTDNASVEIASANFPAIRQFQASRQGVELPRMPDVSHWTVCSPDSAGKFSAVSYFFAQKLFRDLGVPVGILNSSWGGTPIETWISREALTSNPVFDIVWHRWADDVAAFPARVRDFKEKSEVWEAAALEAKKQGEEYKNPRPKTVGDVYGPSRPARLFDTMVAPYVSFPVRGILWYQGEQNAGQPGEYQALLTALIRDWRARWQLDDLPFYVVQLPNYKGGNAQGLGWAKMREAQTNALSEPNTALAVTIDVGNPNDVHPTNKRPVGERLALIAEGKEYGRSVVFLGPTFAGSAKESNGIRVQFGSAEGLHAKGDAPLGFEVAGDDRRFFPARATIEKDTVVISSPDVPAPVAVRYAWRNAPSANLYNAAELPAAPFRTDSW
jgi:sialate O-acetylesterase